MLGGRKVEDKEFVVLTELLMMQLLKLDGIEAEGEARAQRKAEVHNHHICHDMILLFFWLSRNFNSTFF